jgi:hypothetical protein
MGYDTKRCLTLYSRLYRAWAVGHRLRGLLAVNELPIYSVLHGVFIPKHPIVDNQEAWLPTKHVKLLPPDTGLKQHSLPIERQFDRDKCQTICANDREIARNVRIR